MVGRPDPDQVSESPLEGGSMTHREQIERPIRGVGWPGSRGAAEASSQSAKRARPRHRHGGRPTRPVSRGDADLQRSRQLDGVARDHTPRFLTGSNFRRLGVESCPPWTAVVESSNQLLTRHRVASRVASRRAFNSLLTRAFATSYASKVGSQVDHEHAAGAAAKGTLPPAAG